MKALIIFFSYGGNTRSIARMIAQKIKADVLEIEPEKPYVGSYDSVVSQGAEEVFSNYLPAIKPVGDLAAYDTIILGSPVWWFTLAPVVQSFLHQQDLTGKTIYPFVTNGGTIGNTFDDLVTDTPGATVKEGVDIHFDGNSCKTPSSEIEAWIASITV